MTTRLSLQGQILAGILIALLVGFLSGAVPAQLGVAGPVETPPPSSTATDTPSTALPSPDASPTPEALATVNPPLFQTIEGVWMVRVKFYHNAEPEFVRVLPLGEGRLSVTQGGDSHLQIIDAQGNILYTTNFAVSFIAGDPPQTFDTSSIVMILPRMQGEALIKVITPQGEVEYEIQ